MIYLIILAISFTIIPNSLSTDTEQCSIYCFFTNVEKEFIKCDKKPENNSVDNIQVTCEKKFELSIGDLESIRTLNDNFFENIPEIQYLTINLHMMTLESEVLKSKELTELNLVYIEKINKDSFINLPKLENINFGRITSKQLPEFFILRHLKPKQITTVNIEVSCYKCDGNSQDLFVFPISSKKSDHDSYILQSINSESCPFKNDLKFCNNSIIKTTKDDTTVFYKSLRLDQKLEMKIDETKTSISIPIALFYIGLIVCLTMTVLILCLLLLQLWTICQLRKANKILKGLHVYPIMNESELSDNNESNSYIGNNTAYYQHNFSRPKV